MTIMPVCVPVHQLPHASGLPMPSYQSAGAAGFDLAAALEDGQTMVLAPLMRVLVPTGLVFQIPHGYEGQVRPRSGLAVKYGISVLNSPGTIDADYRGEIQVVLINLGQEPFIITRGMRIAQMVVAPVAQVLLTQAVQAGETERGSGGFGSTGLT